MPVIPAAHRPIYAEALKNAVDTACMPLMNWAAFAEDCIEQGQPQMADLATAMANFQQVVQPIVDPV